MVSVATSTSRAWEPGRTFTVLTGRPHPRVVPALQVAASITKTLPFGLATYTVRVAGLTTAATGNFPTFTVATGRLQPRVTVALHRAPFSTETVLLLPLVT